MKLFDLNTGLAESRFFVYAEANEGPRWKFRYDKWKHDQEPDILLLGAYQNPDTLNDLIGGINLHYLDHKQIDELAAALPTIMAGKNLKQRYWLGRRTLPVVFGNYYRTYDPKYIRGVTQDVMYPKYGLSKQIQKSITKQLKDVGKPKAQRTREAMPQYPSDLQSMRHKLDDVVTKLQTQPETPANEPELRQARDEYTKLQRNKSQAVAGTKTTDIDTTRHNFDDYMIDNSEQEQQTQSPKRQLAQELEKDYQENTAELSDPDNDLDPNVDLEESIIYYSPVLKRHVIETIKI